ncbi:MAG: bifunctional DNA-formamidopyrimidine glycosylase/DNA-(apurinic or apyrimidinic site) lyase [Actinobacteria bacterium]|nr:bifunctional DNA-formamidopyrimidine glycosylase/DNA-(apurinic or apyrimidinic site) lyase [Actinomycetota bacterium]
MPELPEVEVVRQGLDRFVSGRRIERVEVFGARAVRRHPAGAVDFVAQLGGVQLLAAQRRGKFLWLPLADSDSALVAHLGMSGQLVLPAPGSEPERHLRVMIHFADGGRPLRFVDQRTFGWLAVEPLVAGVAGREVPMSVARIAADAFEPTFDPVATSRRIRRSRSTVKAVLLDQQVVSGIGNIYADEALWRSRRHWATPANRLRHSEVLGLLENAATVMAEALSVGGTSFDSLYVDVNGTSGYFERSLDAYGRAGRPCRRCGSTIRRESFGNRSSFRCPRCQRRPRGVG